MKESADDHPGFLAVHSSFADALLDVLDRRLELTNAPQLAEYLGEMLVRFMRWDGVYGVRDAFGRPVTSVAEMMAEGDVRLKANSFDRERAVHQHIGDFLLFWSGFFPEFLNANRKALTQDLLVDPVVQGRYSYHVASTFDHGTYAHQAPILRQLSEEFEACQIGLSMVKTRFPGLA